MSEDGVGVELLVEGIDQECLVLFAVLDGCGGLFEDVFRGVHEDLVQVFLVADLVEKGVERLDPDQFLLHADGIPEGEESLKVAKCHRWTGQRKLRLFEGSAYLASRSSHHPS